MQRGRGVGLGGALVLLLGGSACQPPQVRYEAGEPWPGAPLPGAERARLLVTNTEEDTVSFFRPEALGEGELVRMPVGLSPVEREGPHHAALSARGDWFAIPLTFVAPGQGGGPHAGHGTGEVEGALVVYDATTGERRGQVRLDVNPGDALASPDGRTVYVSHFDLARVQRGLAEGASLEEMTSNLVVVDVEGLTRTARIPLCPAAHGMAFSPDRTRLYVTCLTDEVVVVDLTRPELPVTHVPLREGAGDPRSVLHGPYALAVSPTSGEVWVSCLEGNDLHVLRPDTLTFDAARTRRLTGTPYFGQVTADGATLYVPTQAPDLVVEVDTATGGVRRQVRVDDAGCTRAHQLMLLAGEAEAAVVCEGETGRAGALLVLDVAAGSVRHTLPVGVRPDYVGVLPARETP